MAVLRRVATGGRITALVAGGLVLVALYVLVLWRAPGLLVNQDLLHDPQGAILWSARLQRADLMEA